MTMVPLQPGIPAAEFWRCADSSCRNAGGARRGTAGDKILPPQAGWPAVVKLTGFSAVR
jgi:hypothetical protein